MTMLVSSEKELAEAIKAGKDEIEIEGDLARKTIRIKATGTVTWMIAIGAIAVAVIIVLASPATAGVSSIAGIAALAPAAGILGTGAAVSAVCIAVSGGGIGVLNQLRNYKLTKLPNGRVLLKK